MDDWDGIYSLIESSIDAIETKYPNALADHPNRMRDLVMRALDRRQLRPRGWQREIVEAMDAARYSVRISGSAPCNVMWFANSHKVSGEAWFVKWLKTRYGSDVCTDDKCADEPLVLLVGSSIDQDVIIDAQKTASLIVVISSDMPSKIEVAGRWTVRVLNESDEAAARAELIA